MGDPKGPKLFSENIQNAATNKSHNIDYSLTNAEDIFFAPVAGQTAYIHRMIISISDSGAFASGGYGAIVGPLTNGVEIFVDRDSDDKRLYTLTDIPILTNGQWSSLCYDAKLSTYGSGDGWLSMRFSFDKFGGPIILRGDYGERFGIGLSDDFSGLTGHFFMVQGKWAINGPGYA